MEIIAKPLSSLDAWTRHFSTQPIPVLGRTVHAIQALSAKQDQISARDIAAEVRRDPLMTLRTLVWAGKAMRRRSQAGLTGEIETVEAAIVMMGVTPFFREFSNLSSFETHLADYPQARLHLLRVIGRSLAASGYAADWAVYRHDLDAAVIQEAALLHDLAEMLTWCFAPTLSIQMQQMRTASPTMRSAEIQQTVLGVLLEDLSIELLRDWRLPSLLLRLANHHESGNPAVQNVLLAANLARHAAHGWADPALRDDYEQIAKLLNQSPEWVQRRIEGSDGSDGADEQTTAAVH